MKKCTQGDPEAVCFVWGGGVPQGTVLVAYRLGSDLFSLVGAGLRVSFSQGQPVHSGDNIIAL